MVDWTGTTVQIVIALIGSSSVFVAGLGGYFSELNKPDIHVDLIDCISPLLSHHCHLG